ncbi:glycosyltransferase [Methylobacterium haplocladii]|uniref:Glycosyl transferase n=1 Tax=Methylobacterium haplocladii TaxID=1176176 RepID=A0A512IQF5_9HYPH|nr:glycosyltransferase [Methylobacterium haplocladii]GEO99953.1 glycosyl transferase [Methylobacterium haplocladii]GJD86222.1 4'-demethylrebeccamycin synthase [Methylobacterium haplocladii]GLS59667.1 glycosyl transferase [Methylobacterium haplocladii]
MKVLIAATPLMGHINPLLAIGRLLTKRGDDVLVTTSAAFAMKVEGAGLRFASYPDDGASEFRETGLPAGPERYRREFARRFIDPMPVQAEALRALIASERPDIVVAGSMFLGVLPLLLDRERPRPPIVTVNISFLFLDRPDKAPVGMGLPPAKTEAERAHYAMLGAGMDAAFVNPVRAYTDAMLARMGLPPLPASLPHSIALLPDAFLQPTVPAFEYDFQTLPPGLRFVGLLPSAPSAAQPRPDWWHELDRGRPVVLVTQGTLANHDFSELLEPTLQALADRDDLLVIATTGGRPVESIGVPIPANARVAPFLPFDALLPKVDLFVTNGGYGSVSMALAAGVPIVSAGLTEDKAEINARIAWSGAGLDLATNTPSAAALREATGTVLGDSRFRERAGMLSDAFAGRDARREILSALDDLTRAGTHSARSRLASSGPLRAAHSNDAGSPAQHRRAS